MAENVTPATLRGAVNTMSALAQSGFCRIKGIAECALMALETVGGQRDTESLALALEAISSICDDIENCINCESDAVGESHVCERWRRRLAAFSAVRNEAGVQP